MARRQGHTAASKQVHDGELARGKNGRTISRNPHRTVTQVLDAPQQRWRLVSRGKNGVRTRRHPLPQTLFTYHPVTRTTELVCALWIQHASTTQSPNHRWPAAATSSTSLPLAPARAAGSGSASRPPRVERARWCRAPPHAPPRATPPRAAPPASSVGGHPRGPPQRQPSPLTAGSSGRTRTLRPGPGRPRHRRQGRSHHSVLRSPRPPRPPPPARPPRARPPPAPPRASLRGC